MFKRIPDGEALIATGGVYKPADLYEYRGKLFAKVGGGYILLKTNGSTSKEGTRLHELHYDGDLFQNPFGHVCSENGPDRKPVHITYSERDGVQLLTSAPAS